MFIRDDMFRDSFFIFGYRDKERGLRGVRMSYYLRNWVGRRLSRVESVAVVFNFLGYF